MNQGARPPAQFFYAIVGLFLLAFVGLSVSVASHGAAAPEPTPYPQGTPIAASFPIRAAFVYLWYPGHWAEGSRYNPILYVDENSEPVFGHYSSDDSARIGNHVDQLQAAGVDAALSSWWGRGHETDTRLLSLLNAANAKAFKVGVYYELDQDGSRSLSAIRNDLRYLRDAYFSHPAYLYVEGRPVVFVYAPQGTCATANKWKQAKNTVSFYGSMIDVLNWWQDCPTAMDSWHQYRPDLLVTATTLGSRLYSTSISAGFWAAWEAEPRLTRNYDNWLAAVDWLGDYSFDWQLLFFNEWGEGSGIEASNARCEEIICLDYLLPLGANP